MSTASKSIKETNNCLQTSYRLKITVALRCFPATARLTYSSTSDTVQV